jgi:hypothetical protein
LLISGRNLIRGEVVSDPTFKTHSRMGILTK